MSQISPRLLGILVVATGVGGALQFRRPASDNDTRQQAASSDSIQWRSNDFTLEVAAHDQKSTGSPYADHQSSSPAFGGAGGVVVNSQASLDQVQPPALAGKYEPGSAVTRPDIGGPASPGAHAATSGEATTAPTTPPNSVAITHEISAGDSLEALAEKHLGSRLRWTEIYNANPEILDNPEVLPPGVTIVILPGVRPSTGSSESEGLVPVTSSDLLRFRQTTD